MSFAKITNFGFDYNGCKIERLAASDGKRRYAIIQVTAMNGDIIEIIMRPRGNTITTIKRSRK